MMYNFQDIGSESVAIYLLQLNNLKVNFAMFQLTVGNILREFSSSRPLPQVILGLGLRVFAPCTFPLKLKNTQIIYLRITLWMLQKDLKAGNTIKHVFMLHTLLVMIRNHIHVHTILYCNYRLSSHEQIIVFSYLLVYNTAEHCNMQLIFIVTCLYNNTLCCTSSLVI